MRCQAQGEEGLRVLTVLQQCQEGLDEGKTRHRPTEPTHPAKSYFAHESAFIDDGVEIGAGTRIWHYSHVMTGAKIGRNCVLGQNVFVGHDVCIGEGVKIQNNVSVYEGVELEDYVFCGPSMVFTNVINPRSGIERKHEFQKTLVKQGATLGADCSVLCGITIGRYAFVGAGAVVTKDVPDYALVVGVPARITGWVCECGVKLKVNEKKGECPICTKQYRKKNDRMQPLSSHNEFGGWDEGSSA